MMSQKDGTLLFLVLCLGLSQMVKTQNIEARISLEINERGTKFIEHVEISRENTAIFSVPAHNNIERSYVLIDYNQKLSVTRIPRLEECHIEDLDDDDESSSEQMMMNIVKLKLMYNGKPKIIHTISRTVMKNGTVNASSLAIATFCGNFPIFKMVVIEVEDSDVIQRDHRIKKRSLYDDDFGRIAAHISSLQDELEDGPTVDEERSQYDDDFARIAAHISSVQDELEDGPTVDEESSSSWSGSGFIPLRRPHVNHQVYDVSQVMSQSKVRCKKLQSYNLDACIGSGAEDWDLTRVVNSDVCMYQVKCRDPRVVNGKIRRARCFEKHVHSREICYDVSCKKPLPVYSLK